MTRAFVELTDVAVGHQGKAVLENVNLSITAGRWVALVGPNASGKTTLLQTLAGRLAPLGGNILMDGRPLYPAHAGNSRLPAFAIAPEDLPPFLTVRQSLEIQASAHGLPALPDHTVEFGRRLGLEIHAHTLIRNASLGTKQKLAVLLALMLQRPLVLLDEVFNGLDFSSAMQLRKHLRQQVDSGAMTILLATHALDTVLRCCDELVQLEPGKPLRRWLVSDFMGDDPLAAMESALAGGQPSHQAANSSKLM